MLFGRTERELFSLFASSLFVFSRMHPLYLCECCLLCPPLRGILRVFLLHESDEM